MGSRKLLIRSSSTSTSEASEKVYLFDFVSSFEVCMYVKYVSYVHITANKKHLIKIR